MNAAQARDITDRVIKERESKVDLALIYEEIKMTAQNGDDRYWPTRTINNAEVKELEKNGYEVTIMVLNNVQKITW